MLGFTIARSSLSDGEEHSVVGVRLGRGDTYDGVCVGR